MNKAIKKQGQSFDRLNEQQEISNERQEISNKELILLNKQQASANSELIKQTALSELQAKHLSRQVELMEYEINKKTTSAIIKNVIFELKQHISHISGLGSNVEKYLLFKATYIDIDEKNIRYDQIEEIHDKEYLASAIESLRIGIETAIRDITGEELLDLNRLDAIHEEISREKENLDRVSQIFSEYTDLGKIPIKKVVKNSPRQNRNDILMKWWFLLGLAIAGFALAVVSIVNNPTKISTPLFLFSFSAFGVFGLVYKIASALIRRTYEAVGQARAERLKAASEKRDHELSSRLREIEKIANRPIFAGDVGKLQFDEAAKLFEDRIEQLREEFVLTTKRYPNIAGVVQLV
ncbi:hypothetical protein MesoLj113b_34490 [Mesorhizobium sp. 113-3-3]|nr:hypothetical protein MesoLj113b_34490 [Mesorhizobium sp. 113-3-3]